MMPARMKLAADPPRDTSHPYMKADAKFRLLVLASTYPRWRGDPEPGFVHELCRRLTDRFDVVVVTPHAPGAEHREVMDGVTVRRFAYAPTRFESLVHDGGIAGNLKRSRWKWLLVPGFFLMSLLAHMRALREFHPHVVHAHWLIPQGLVAALVQRILPNAPPFMVTSHGADLYTLRSPAFLRLKRFVVARADRLTVVSRAMVPTVMALGATDERTSVRAMGVDLTARFKPGGQGLRMEGEILFVGRLVEKKGLRYLIDAMSIIVACRPEAHLTIVGFGPEAEQRRRQVEDLGLDAHVTFVGAVAQDRLPEYYHRASVLVAPFVRAVNGDQEGLGLVAVEALACGCPVILGDVDAVSDVKDVIPERVDVTPVDSEAIAKAVLARLGRSPETGSTKELDAAFSWHSVGEDYSQMLVQLAIRGIVQALRRGRTQ